MIAGTTVQAISTSSSNKVNRRTFTLTTSDKNYGVTMGCSYPAPDAGIDVAAGGYTATPTTLILYVTGTGAAVLEFTYTKQ